MIIEIIEEEDRILDKSIIDAIQEKDKPLGKMIIDMIAEKDNKCLNVKIIYQIIFIIYITQIFQELK
jgi:hypothetical protein